MGDRWRSNDDGIKGHDLQVWTPLYFNPDGSIRSLAAADEVKIAVRKVLPRKIVDAPYSWPLKADPHPLDRDPCNHAPLTPVQSGAVLPAAEVFGR